MNRLHIIFILLAVLVLSACTPAAGDLPGVELPTTTAAATEITVPTTVATTPDVTAAVTPTATSAADTVTAVPTATATSAASVECTDAVAFIADVSVPDGTQFAPRTGFNKTWRLQNSGTCTWDGGYKLVHAGNNRLGAIAASFALPKSVAPGQTIDLTVSLVSPAEPAAYQSDWKLQNGAGQNFGVGPNHNNPFWVKIVVAEPQPDHDGRISGFAWQDQDFDDEVETSEFLANVAITLSSGENCATTVATVNTDAAGRFVFENLAAGTYCLTGTDGSVTVSQSGLVLAADEHVADVNVTWPPVWPEAASISGWLWHDFCAVTPGADGFDNVDGNCVPDGNGGYVADGMIQPDEEYIAGVTVKLVSGSCVGDDAAAQLITVTDSSGKFSFQGLGPGVYCVFIDAAEAGSAAILLDGVWTFPGYGEGFHEITVGAGEDVQPVNFGWDVDES